MRFHISRHMLSVSLLLSSATAVPALAAHNTTAPSMQDKISSYPIPAVKQYWARHKARQAFHHLSSNGQEALLSILEAKHILASGKSSAALPALTAASAHLVAASSAQERFTAAENSLKPAPQHPLPPNHVPQTGPTDWVPVSGDIIANTTLTPEKKARVAAADAQLKLGESQLAAQTLSKLRQDVDYIIALAPLSQTKSSVNRALTLAKNGNAKGANAALDDVINSLVFVSENVITTATAVKTSSH